MLQYIDSAAETTSLKYVKKYYMLSDEMKLKGPIYKSL
jgi:hypothetical protein